MSLPRPPAGRYGPEPDPATRRRRVLALWALGVVSLLTAVWFGVGAAQTPVSWQDVGFRIDGAEQVEVVFDVTRSDPTAEVRCRVEARNASHAQVGVLTVEIPTQSMAIRVTTTVRTSEPAVTGLVDSCWVVAD